MAQLGYTALYLDNDVAVLKDPIAPAYVGSPYDIQVSAGDGFACSPPGVFSLACGIGRSPRIIVRGWWLAHKLAIHGSVRAWCRCCDRV